MKTKSIITVAAIALLPIAAFAQPNPPTPPGPPPGPPPNGPVGPGGDREHHEKKVPVTYLGVETSDVPRVVSEQLGLPRGFGLVVDYVVPDGPAAAAGVQQNDIIRMLNDQILTEPDQLSKLIRSFSEGTTVTLTVLRKGKEEKIGVKLSKKEVSERSDMFRGHHPNYNFNFNGHDFGDWGMGDLKEQMEHLKENLKEQLGDSHNGVIHDAIMTAQQEAQRAVEQQRRDMQQQQRDMAQQQRDMAHQIRDQMREQAQHVRDEERRTRDEARRAAGITVNQHRDGGMSTTKIDIGKAQIVYSDDKGELRVEKIDGKKVLTAKDPKGLLQFSGPVETKEDLDKVPADVRQRYDKLQQNDLPAVISEHQSEMDNDNDADDEDDDNDQADIQSMNQVCTKPAGQPVNYTFVKI
ncbi:MAG TPA: PDZ domain-containing protein [Chthoniobacterales bacterium]|nr:PDZ domain-containing protein [Chthoniobacterales bacterium]